MDVTVHSVFDVETANDRVFGLNDLGYDLAMDFMKHNRCEKRYEYFGTDEEIEFQWDMKEEDYALLKKPPKEWTPNNYLGAVFFGNCKLEFILHQLSEEESYIYCNMFVRGQEGYDYLPDGTPYAEYEGFASKFESDLPRRRTFDSFARHIEKDIVDVLNEYYQLINDAVAPTNPEKWYPGYKHDYMQKITRRA